MNWRDGHASNWGDAIRQANVDHDAELEAWEMAAVMAETQLNLARERIEHLKRDKARSMLSVVPVANAPAASRN